MKRYTFVKSVLSVAGLLLVGGCADTRRGSSAGESGETPPAILTSGPRAVVEEYLKAAASTDGAGMYALIATSERDDETPQSLKDTAHDRYSPGMSWEVLKDESSGNAASVVVEFKGGKVEPNPYKFTLTQEAGEWRIVQSPELHEDDTDGIDIKL